MSQTDRGSAASEGRFHHYTGNQIPWYIHLLWILFWSFVAYYLLQYLIPMIPVELQSPP
jgi:hypothetical protein